MIGYIEHHNMYQHSISIDYLTNTRVYTETVSPYASAGIIFVLTECRVYILTAVTMAPKAQALKLSSGRILT